MVYFAKWKMVLVGIICLLGLSFAAPNFIPLNQAEALPGWLPRQHISLGLDLQGGSHLLLEVDSKTVIREYLDSMVDAARIELRRDKIRYQGLGISGNGIQVTIKDEEKVGEARKLLRAIERDAVLDEDDGRIVMT